MFEGMSDDEIVEFVFDAYINQASGHGPYVEALMNALSEELNERVGARIVEHYHGNEGG